MILGMESRSSLFWADDAVRIEERYRRVVIAETPDGIEERSSNCIRCAVVHVRMPTCIKSAIVWFTR
jgi:hypothetical protein